MTDTPQITLSWMRDQDGVIVVYATDEGGKRCAVADFWVRPLRENLGLERGQAKALQQQLAEQLVDSWSARSSTERAEENVRLRAICEYVALFQPASLPIDEEVGFDVAAAVRGDQDLLDQEDHSFFSREGDTC